MDYIFTWMEKRFLGTTAPLETDEGAKLPTPVVEATPKLLEHTRYETDAPTCHECGSIMVRSGSCHRCINCGATSGCS